MTSVIDRMNRFYDDIMGLRKPAVIVAVVASIVLGLSFPVILAHFQHPAEFLYSLIIKTLPLTISVALITSVIVNKGFDHITSYFVFSLFCLGFSAFIYSYFVSMCGCAMADLPSSLFDEIGKDVSKGGWPLGPFFILQSYLKLYGAPTFIVSVICGVMMPLAVGHLIKGQEDLNKKNAGPSS